jgi:parallel beta-helix repeat protein
MIRFVYCVKLYYFHQPEMNGVTLLWIILPKPWCAIACWSLMASIFVKKPFFYNFASLSALLCSVVFFVYPGVGYNNEHLLFENWYSILTHALLLTTSITMMVLGYTDFQYKDFWKTGLCFLLTFGYGFAEIFLLKTQTDPMYFMPGGDIQADILHLSYGLYLFLYILIFLVFINVPYEIPARTSNIDVTDCHIRYYGRIYNNSIGVLITHAIDCDITYNEIHDGWYTAVSVGWNWGYTDNPTNNIQIKNNLIYNIGNGWLSDMGGIYTLGIQPDTVLSGNIIHNVGCYEGSTGYGGWGIYLDEGSSNITVEKNLVYDCSSNSLHQHYGKDNLIKNNIFAFSDDGQMLITRQEEHNSLFLYNNILVGDNEAMYDNAVDKDWFIDNNNLYWDYENGEKVFSDSNISVKKMKKRGYYNNAVFADPGFKDAENRNFTLSLNSPALDTGFEAWEYEAGTRIKY